MEFHLITATIDISNVIATFCPFHHWHHNDPIKAETLVYTLFLSPALMLMDVVVGKNTNVGGARKSWTTTIIIISA